MAVAVIVIVAWPREREPVYKGKKLSEWLARSMRGDREADDAVRKIGTNAIPYLFKWVSGESSEWNRTLSRISSRVPTWIGNRAYSFLAGEEGHGEDLGLHGFEVLGSVASPAVPELVRRLSDTNDVANARVVWAFALARIGKDGLPALLGKLEDPDAQERAVAVVAIGLMRPSNAASAIPALVSRLEDEDYTVAQSAVRAIGNLAVAPEIAVPALTDNLRYENGVLEFLVVRSLAAFGPEAKDAVPALVKELDCPGRGSVERHALLDALQKIAPEVALRYETNLHAALPRNERTAEAR